MGSEERRKEEEGGKCERRRELKERGGADGPELLSKHTLHTLTPT